jgi:uncharacterized protein (DUF2252 family)
MSTSHQAAVLDPLFEIRPLPTLKERFAEGKARRNEVPRDALGLWHPSAHRADPIALLEESNKPRLQNLVPIRYGRMIESPFTYLRGSPIVMASDLSTTPNTGFQVQASGDCHLTNFGVYASPERNLLFDLNDFDETLPGPWEWDLKRLAASCVVAGRVHHVREADCLEAALSVGRSYAKHMRRYSRMHLLDVWYSRVDARAVLRLFQADRRHTITRDLFKARQRNTLQALSKLATTVDGRLRLIENPPLVTHIHDDNLRKMLHRLAEGYLASLQDDRRELIHRYRFVDFAMKVVGVGSVGTRCFIALLAGSHNEDPLLLQIKEALPSVLAPYVGKSNLHNHGHRVVNGQRLLQSASDIFLGWTSEGGRDYYIRQLRDMKASANLDALRGPDLIDYAVLCGWVLARAHARTGDAARLAGYLGKSDAFPNALASFATAYADQTERDYKTFKAAVKSGRLPVEKGV